MTVAENNNPSYSRAIRSNPYLGFTIIETILVVAIFSLLVAAAVTFFQSFQVSYQLNTSIDELTQNLRRAQVFTQSSKGDSKYGLYFVSGQGGSYTFFKGNTYAGRDPNFDEVYNFPGALTLTYSLGGSQQIIFSKPRGLPSATGTITITTVNNQSKTVEINSQGRVKLQ